MTRRPLPPSISKIIGLFIILGGVIIPLNRARAAGPLYAAPTAQNSGSCNSWADACTLQTALNTAASGDEIWVKAGVYYPGALQTDTFTLKNGVAIYGGFAGGESTIDQRDWRANLTILSGDIDGNDTNTDGNFIAETAADIQGNNAYHVVTGGGVNSSAVLDGFVVTAGQAGGDSTSDYDSGGGMYNASGSPTLENIAFSGNYADNGGGMYNDTSNPSLTHITFSGNSGLDGGGMYNYNTSSPALSGVVFSGNSAVLGGGMLNASSSPTLKNATFSGNSATSGGGMYNGSSSPVLQNSILWGDSATNGPEIYNNDGSSIPNVTYSIVQGGYAGAGNLDSDPLFVDPAGNLRLDFGSPAIDAGTNTGCQITDLDGLPGPNDGNGDTTSTCDMGAYEAGKLVCGVTQSSSYAYPNQSGVSIEVTTLGAQLNCLYVDEMEIDHPQATSGIQTGRYWLIRGLQSDKHTAATGFSLSLTLPASFSPGANDKVCRYTGSGQVWDCAMDSNTLTSITRDGVTALSDWAVGKSVGPTAVALRGMSARSPHTPLAILGFGLFLMAGSWLFIRRALS